MDAEPNMSPEVRPATPQDRLPVHETDTSVSYLGVRLEKAQSKDSQFVPKKEAYADYISDKFALDLQKQIAVSFHQGEPLLIEGGTSIGKTTTVRKMASDLGWEVHYANLNGATDVEDLMGRYIPNPDKHGPEDPEYVFADGKVTSGLRPEEGKVKVILLDEFNSSAPNILIRLHEVLDALQRGENVVLSEDASETIHVDKQATKVVALMNPPGKGYFGREPLDPAQLRRWVYFKAPTDLPEETFSYSVDSLFGVASGTQEAPQQAFLEARDVALLPEQLREIPGIQDILGKYKEFHKGAKALVKERKVAADQPQPFTYDDRMEPQRVMNFVAAFYNGDVNATFQQALEYYYTNKLESDVDRAQLEEIMRHVEYTPPVNTSQRRGLDRDAIPGQVEPRVDIVRPIGTETSELARREQDAWQSVLGTMVEVKPLPETVTPEVRRNLERLGFDLRYVPKIELADADAIRRKGVDQYLKDLQRQYRNWKPYESLSERESSDHKVPRNLMEWYWELVKDGKVDMPVLPGQWLAVETVDKPSYGNKYSRTAFAEKLGFRDDRFNVSWNDAHNAIESQKRGVLGEVGISGRSADIRLLEAPEWNLLGNREGWGATDTYEWTNTEYRASGDSNRLVAGFSDDGGAARAAWVHPSHSVDRVGFRAAVVLGS